LKEKIIISFININQDFIFNNFTIIAIIDIIINFIYINQYFNFIQFKNSTINFIVYINNY